MEHSILLFDGICNFCNGSVNFIIDHDPQKHFRFASLQSEGGQELLRKFNLPTEDFDSLVLVEGERYFKKSTAGLRIARSLTGLWPLLYALIIIPTPLRDLGYNLIAKNRYKWFGKADSCRMPTPELRERFLSL